MRPYLKKKKNRNKTYKLPDKLIKRNREKTQIKNKDEKETTIDSDEIQKGGCFNNLCFS